jgi:hypothetical protein
VQDASKSFEFTAGTAAIKPGQRPLQRNPHPCGIDRREDLDLAGRRSPMRSARPSPQPSSSSIYIAAASGKHQRRPTDAARHRTAFRLFLAAGDGLADRSRATSSYSPTSKGIAVDGCHGRSAFIVLNGGAGTSVEL